MLICDVYKIEMKDKLVERNYHTNVFMRIVYICISINYHHIITTLRKTF